MRDRWLWGKYFKVIRFLTRLLINNNIIHNRSASISRVGTSSGNSKSHCYYSMVVVSGGQ